MILATQQPWWETTTGMLVIIGAIVSGLSTLITLAFTNYAKVKRELIELRKDQKETQQKATVAEVEAKVAKEKADHAESTQKEILEKAAKLEGKIDARVHFGDVRDQRILEVEKRVADLLKESEPNGKK